MNDKCIAPEWENTWTLFPLQHCYLYFDSFNMPCRPERKLFHDFNPMNISISARTEFATFDDSLFVISNRSEFGVLFPLNNYHFHSMPTYLNERTSETLAKWDLFHWWSSQSVTIVVIVVAVVVVVTTIVTLFATVTARQYFIERKKENKINFI